MSGVPAGPGLLRLNPSDRAAPVGAYSHGVVAPANGRWLYIAGQVGLRPDGSVPGDFESQAAAAWENLLAVLRAADMDIDHLVKVTSFLTDVAQVPVFARVRSGFLGQARPASTLLVVPALARPEWQVEVEAVACRP